MKPRNSRSREENAVLGKRIRERRKFCKISLDELARNTALSIGFLSQLETGKVNVSVDNLRKIASFLDVDMVNFFEVRSNVRTVGSVTRKGEGMSLNLEGTETCSESLIRKGDANLQATLFVNPPGQGRNMPNSHVGEEFIYTIKGQVDVFLNDQKYCLNEGDSIYFRSEAMHTWVNPNHDEESVILLVNSPQVW